MLMQGAGAAMSPALTGSIAGHYSCATAFGVLSVIAIVALMIWWRTLRCSPSPRHRQSARAGSNLRHSDLGREEIASRQQPPAARLTCEWR